MRRLPRQVILLGWISLLADISGEEVEAYMLANGLVGDSSKSTSVPLNSPCTDAEHAAMVNIR